MTAPAALPAAGGVARRREPPRTPHRCAFSVCASPLCQTRHGAPGTAGGRAAVWGRARRARAVPALFLSAFECPLIATAKPRRVELVSSWAAVPGLASLAAVGRLSPPSTPLWPPPRPRFKPQRVVPGLCALASDRPRHPRDRGMAPSPPSLGLMDLPPEVLNLVLIAVADPWSLQSLSRTCRRLAAAASPSAPLCRTLLAKHVDLTRLPGFPTEWETEFFCYWDDSFGEPTDAVAFAPPLSRVRGWPEGVLSPVPLAVVEEALDQHESAEAVADEAEEYGDPMRDDAPQSSDGEMGSPHASTVDAESAQEGSDGVESDQDGADEDWLGPEGADEEGSDPDGADDMGSDPDGADEEGPDYEVADGEEPDEVGAGKDGSAQDDPAKPRPPVGSFLYVDNRAVGTGTTAPGAAAAAGEDDPRALYIGLATLSRAAAAVQTAEPFDCDCGWGTEALHTEWHLLAVRITPGSIAWPAADAPTEAVVAAADALMAAAGADTHARASIVPRIGGVRPEAARPGAPAWSGRPGGPLFRTNVAGPAVRHRMGKGPDDEWSLAARRAQGAAMVAVEAVLGDRPVLAFHFGEEAMNPTGGVMAVQWSPSLVLGLLLPIVHT